MKRENLQSMTRFAKVYGILLWGVSISYAQDMLRVRSVIGTLASPAYHGRGYVNNGDSLAADYIHQKLDSLGIKPLGSNGFQRFKLDVNTFPEELELQINKTKLIPGIDFIAAPNSGAAKGKYRLIYCDSSILVSSEFKSKNQKNLGKKTAIWLDLSAQRALKKQSGLIGTITAAGLRIETKTKLTASLAQQANSQAIIWIRDGLMESPKGRVSCTVKNDLLKDYPTKNIVYKIEGTVQPDSFLVVSAHYDHLGRMGPSVYFPGANDNASGVAFLLELANYYAKNPPKYSIIFIAFAAEEVGLIGSEYFVNHPLVPLNKIKFLVNLDLVGTGDDGIQVVNSTIFTNEFARLKEINTKENYFQTVKTRGKAANSDHYYFSEKGVPSFFIYALGGITAYHDVNDTSEKLPLTKFKELFQLTIKFLDSF